MNKPKTKIRLLETDKIIFKDDEDIEIINSVERPIER